MLVCTLFLALAASAGGFRLTESINDDVVAGTEGFFFQLLREIAFYSLDECTGIAYEVFNHGVTAFDYVFQGLVWEGIMELAVGAHKSPRVYYECLDLLDEYNTILNAFNRIIFVDWADSLINYVINLCLNGVDIYYEALLSGTAFESRDWGQFGESLAKIFSDIFVKNGYMENWTYHNSEAIGERLYSVDHGSSSSGPSSASI